MKKKILLLILIIFTLTGCSKYTGTWCRYTETYSTLVITNKDITEKELSKLESKIKDLKDLKTYDISTDIKDGNTTITIYFNTKEAMNESEEELSNLDGIESIELNSFKVPSEELIIKGKNYTYGKDLDNIDSFERKGTYTKKTNYIETNSGLKFYYKDKYLCTDEECNNILVKVDSKTC